jgi:hypothetical protein
MTARKGVASVSKPWMEVIMGEDKATAPERRLQRVIAARAHSVAYFSADWSVPDAFSACGCVLRVP